MNVSSRNSTQLFFKAFSNKKKMVVICDCGKQAIIKTSLTNKNPGRRFYYCPACGFIGWADPPMCCQAVDVIPGLLRARNDLEEDLEEQLMLMRKKDEQLKSSTNFLF
ncbi:zinc finger, GRF-type [Artemisia annua]|uniref:Zinc finger, GRF-type n=1 Tax=Artemisia annua TaxID=35608 RepID=A0A2U1PRL2_ARTAN|nr:zinc finger, GRF-type [Artemisia annua]